MPEPYLKRLTNPSTGINYDKSIPKISEPLAFQKHDIGKMGEMK